MNPDEQNNNLNPTQDSGPTMGMDGVTPTIEETKQDASPVSDLGATPQTESQAEPMAAPMGTDTPDLSNMETPMPDATTPEEPTVSAPIEEPMANPTPGMGETLSPADTTFTPVTAGEEVVAPQAAPETTPEEVTPPSMDATAPVNSMDPAAAAPAAGAGLPAKKFKLNTTTIILIAVAAVAIIGVIVTLIISSAS